MIAVVKNEQQIGIKRYVCDKSDELSKIDLRTTRMGSTCFIIEEDANYILNGEGKWIAVKNAEGGSSSESGNNSNEEPGDTIPSDTPQ